MAAISSILYFLFSLELQNSFRRHPTAIQKISSKNELFPRNMAVTHHCPPNEILAECINPCNSCEQHGICLDYVYVCHQGCDCVKGYFRDETGKCIAEEYCKGDRNYSTSEKPSEKLLTDPKDKKNKESLPKFTIESHRCPNPSICAIFCQTMYTKNGRCIGSGKEYCQCY